MVDKAEIVQVFLTPTHLGLAMEYIAGGTLYEYVR